MSARPGRVVARPGWALREIREQPMARTRSIVARLTVLGLTSPLIAACGANTQSPSESPPVSFGHIHGIGENPSDKLVYVATHTGVYRLSPGRSERIANRFQDTMGFTIASPGEFLASGHPALDSTDPNPLGLIRSTDLAESWDAIAFAGKQDFHAIDVVPSRTYAYGASGELYASQDQKTWKQVARADLIDIAADPTAPGKVFATTATGQLVTIDENENGTPSPASATAPALALIDFTSEGAIVGVDPSGQVFVGDNLGANWDKRGALAGVPEAISMRGETWFAATESGVYASSDDGRTWRRLLKIQM